MRFGSLHSNLRIISALALVLISGWIMGFVYLHYASKDLAKTESLQAAHFVAKQTALTIQPYILAEDNISLNFYLNSQTETPLINGISVFNEKKQLLARSGEPIGIEKQVILGSQQTPTGTLTFYVNTQPIQVLLSQLLWQIGILSAIVIAATLLTVWLSLRQRQKSPPQTAVIKSDDLSLQAASLPDKDGVFAKALSEAEAEAEAEAEENNETHSDANEADSADPTTSSDETLNDQDLVQLLRPDSQVRMPHFVPAPMQPETDLHTNAPLHSQPTVPAKQISYTQIAAIEPTEEVEEKADGIETVTDNSNPLRQGRPEIQLDLYSLEHQLELSLQPQEASYLFLIDATTGHADYVEPEEHNYLLAEYELLIKKVSSIYGGDLTVEASGDLQLIFDQQDEEDAHGVHALCAAKLFTLLYRAFNQSRIRAFKPVLNLHMALVRGNRTKANLIKEEALFLTRTTQSNELISHTALTEAKHLKETLLAQAEIRREDEDKVLILSLTESYHELLSRQAEHILKQYYENKTEVDIPS